MSKQQQFEIFLVGIPGLEAALCDEAKQAGFADAKVVAGGVAFVGRWSDVWRANLVLRGASQVLARIGSFHVSHLAQLDKLARKFPWGDCLRKDVALRVEVTCKKSRIYHAGAAIERFEKALREEFGAMITDDAQVCIKARIDNNLCTISLDTSGESLHKRGHKLGIGKAPLRETMAAMFLAQCGYRGEEPLLDPMCGSGTFLIEAAEIAAGLQPGRSREFAFEKLLNFDAAAFQKLKQVASIVPRFKIYGSDRDSGVIAQAKENAARAGVGDFVTLEQRPISALQRPEGSCGLVIVNPPYGARISDKKPLFGLHGALGQILKERFSGWRVGLVTSEPSLAKATGLPFKPTGRSVLHGGLHVQLYQTAPLP